MFKKTNIIMVWLLLLSATILVGCKNDESLNDEYFNYIKQFDLNEEKVYWKGNIDDDFAGDCVIIKLKQNNTYPEFKLKYINIDDAIGFEYLYGPKPSMRLSLFRQTIIIYLSSYSKERVVELIDELNKLPFIKEVYPNEFYDVYV